MLLQTQVVIRQRKPNIHGPFVWLQAIKILWTKANYHWCWTRYVILFLVLIDCSSIFITVICLQAHVGMLVTTNKKQSEQYLTFFFFKGSLFKLKIFNQKRNLQCLQWLFPHGWDWVQDKGDVKG